MPQVDKMGRTTSIIKHLINLKIDVQHQQFRADPNRL